MFFTCILLALIRPGLRHGDAHPLQRRDQRLRGKDRLRAVAGAVQSHHQPVAHQLVVANALDRGHILDPSRLRILLDGSRTQVSIQATASASQDESLRRRSRWSFSSVSIVVPATAFPVAAVPLRYLHSLLSDLDPSNPVPLPAL